MGKDYVQFWEYILEKRTFPAALSLPWTWFLGSVSLLHGLFPSSPSIAMHTWVLVFFSHARVCLYSLTNIILTKSLGTWGDSVVFEAPLQVARLSALEPGSSSSSARCLAPLIFHLAVPLTSSPYFRVLAPIPPQVSSKIFVFASLSHYSKQSILGIQARNLGVIFYSSLFLYLILLISKSYYFYLQNIS